MENENENLEPEVKEEAGAGADNLESEIAEVNDAHEEGAESEAQIDEAEETAEALESFRVALEGIAGQGGLDRNGALMLNLALEHFDRRLGTDVEQPGLESFGNLSSRERATQIAMEAVSDRIKQIWKAIVDAITKAIAWVKGYYNKVFGAAEKLEKRAKALADRAKNTSGTAKNKKIENERVAKALMIQGTMPNVVSEAKHLQSVLAAVVGKTAAKAGEVGEKAAEAIDGLNAAQIPALLKLVDPIDGSEKLANGEVAGLPNPPAGLELYRTKQLFGGQAIISRVPAGESDDLATQVKQLAASTFLVSKYSSSVKEPTNFGVPTLSVSDCENAAGVVEAIAGELLNLRKAQEKIGAAQSKLVAAAKKAANGAGNEEDEAKRKELNAMTSVANAANRLMTQPQASFAKYTLNTAKALLDYVEKSLGEYAAA
jgi:hypothetical protein